MVRSCVRRVSIKPRHLLPLLDQFLQPEQVAVDTLAIRGPRSILQVASNRRAEQLLPPLVARSRVEHRLGPRPALRARRPDDLRAPALELARLRALVAHAGAAAQLVERELHDELRARVRRHPVALQLVLPVPLVVQHRHVVRADERVKVRLGRADRRPRRAVERKRQLPRRRQVGADRGRPVVDPPRGERREDKLRHAERRRAVHARVLAQEPRLPILKHNELVLVVEPVPPIADPALPRNVLPRHRRGIVEGHDDNRRLDPLERVRVRR